MTERTPLLLAGSAPSSQHCAGVADADLAALPVYHTIVSSVGCGWPGGLSSRALLLPIAFRYSPQHLVYNEIVHNVDVPLSDEQLRSPEIQFAIIQPLEQYLGTSLARAPAPRSPKPHP